jgi:hypothetical protein
MVPIYVTFQGTTSHVVGGKTLTGHVRGEDLQLRIEEEGNKIKIHDPFNKTEVGMSLDGLNAINVIVHGHEVHFLGNYVPDRVVFRCCVTLCGTTACCEHASITCGSTTVSC